MESLVTLVLLLSAYLLPLTIGQYNENPFIQELVDNFNKNEGNCVNLDGQSGKYVELQECLQLISELSLFREIPFNIKQDFCSLTAFQPEVCCVIPNLETTDSKLEGNYAFPNKENLNLKEQIVDNGNPEQRILLNPPLKNLGWSTSSPELIVEPPRYCSPAEVELLKNPNKEKDSSLQELSLIPSKELAATIQRHANFRLLSTHRCKADSQEVGRKKRSTSTTKPNCRIPPEEIWSGVIAGQDTEFGANPWMALIEFVDKDDPSFKQFGCSGTLINDKYVLTAAHCLAPNLLPPEFRISKVRFGEYNQSMDPDCSQDRYFDFVCAPKVQDIEVQTVIIHSDFNKANKYEHDIALIRLKTPAQLGSYVSPICLPINYFIDESLSNNDAIEVTGWGRISNLGEETSDVLQSASLPLVSQEKCTQFYQDKFKDFETNSKERFCAGGTAEKDACRGDSGGPATAYFEVETNRSWKQVQLGIISFIAWITKFIYKCGFVYSVDIR